MPKSMGGAIPSNPDLEPEKSLTYEAGFAMIILILSLKRSIMLFQTDFKDKITRSARIAKVKLQEVNL